jgi:uncharacterized repeat protein (TIGR01451 family)
VVLTDKLVSNGAYSVTSAVPSQGSCSQSGDTITCNLGNLNAGSRATLTVTVSSNDAVDVNDVATASSPTPDPNSANNSATGHVSFVASADLALTKSSAPNPVVAGTNLTYTINVSNSGPSAATNVLVQDTLPAQISVISATPSVGSCTGGIPGNPAQPLKCSLGTLAVSGSASITLLVKVNASTPEGTILINNASVSSDVSDANNANNTQTANTTVQARADLAITKGSDKPNYKPNTTITYIVTTTNNGASDALAVVVTDVLPLSQQILYGGNTGGCTQAGVTLTCNLGDMPVGASKSFNVYLLVKGNRGNITNNVSVTSSTTDPNLANNAASKTVSVK